MTKSLQDYIEMAARQQKDTPQTINDDLYNMGFEEGLKDGQEAKANGKEYDDDRYLDYRGDEDDDVFENGYRKGYAQGYKK